jgi:hypothetical protein
LYPAVAQDSLFFLENDAMRLAEQFPSSITI